MVLAIMVFALCAPPVEAAASAWIGQAREYQSVPIGVPVAENAPAAESASAADAEPLSAAGSGALVAGDNTGDVRRSAAGINQATEAGHISQLYKRNCVYRL